MELNINTGVKRIPIKRDGENVGDLVFNPSDSLFAEKYFAFMAGVEGKLSEYQARAKEMASTEAAPGELPENAAEQVGLLTEVCTYFRGQIDNLFGQGTSAMLFGDAMSLDAFEQFFTAITPIIQQARGKKVEQYSGKRAKRAL